MKIDPDAKFVALLQHRSFKGITYPNLTRKLLGSLPYCDFKIIHFLKLVQTLQKSNFSFFSFPF